MPIRNLPSAEARSLARRRSRVGALSPVVAALLLLFPLAGLAQDTGSPESETETTAADAAQDEPADNADASEDANRTEVAEMAKESGRLRIELNRLEQLDGTCRVYLVFQNALGTSLDALQLELVLFDREGFIQRRLTLDAAPIPADKTSVKLFDLADTQCDQMGRILVNDLLKISGPDGALPNDVSQLELSSKLDVDLFQ